MHVQNRCQARIGARELVLRKAELDDARAHAAVLLRNEHAEKAKLRELLHFGVGQSRRAVPLRGGRCDHLLGDAARRVANHDLLLGKKCCGCVCHGCLRNPDASIAVLNSRSATWNMPDCTPLTHVDEHIFYYKVNSYSYRSNCQSETLFPLSEWPDQAIDCPSQSLSCCR